MRAMVLTGFKSASERPLALREVPVPQAGTGEILIKVAFCGVCHTDLHIAEGDLPDVKLPRIPGHEVVGTVEARGAKSRRFKLGDRVGAAWLHSACGTCRFCRSGRENLCESARFTGYHTNGGYAEYMVVPEKFAYAVPRIFSDEEAAPLMCAGIVGYRSLKLSGIKPGGTLGLYGFGASAHVAIQVARHWGCRVFVFTRSEEHRRLAKKLGASWTGLAQEDPRTKLDSAIIFAPAGNLYLDALRVVDRGGTVVSAGHPHVAHPRDGLHPLSLSRADHDAASPTPPGPTGRNCSRSPPRSPSGRRSRSSSSKRPTRPCGVSGPGRSPARRCSGSAGPD